MIPMPDFSTVECPWTGDIEFARDGFCNACGKTDHEVID